MAAIRRGRRGGVPVLILDAERMRGVSGVARYREEFDDAV